MYNNLIVLQKVTPTPYSHFNRPMTSVEDLLVLTEGKLIKYQINVTDKKNWYKSHNPLPIFTNDFLDRDHHRG